MAAGFRGAPGGAGTDGRGHGAGVVRGAFPTSRRSRPRPVTARWIDRRGRGPRGPVLPPQVPRWKTRAQQFDALVLEAFAEIDDRWHSEITRLDLAVDLIPRMRLGKEGADWPPEVSADGPVPLARLVPAGVDTAGRPTRARIVLFRKPLEQRAGARDELADLLHDILVEQIAIYLDRHPDDIEFGGPGTP